MPKRPRTDDAFAATADPFSLFPPPDSLALPDCDIAWAFEADGDTAQMQMQFADLGSSDIDALALPPLPINDHRIHPDTHADVLAGRDLFAAYQPSNGSCSSSSSYSSSTNSTSSSTSKSTSISTSASCSVPACRSTCGSSALSLSSSSSSSSPRFPVVVEAPLHAGAVRRCRSLCRSESCLSTVLRTMTALHVAHSACLSAHQEGPTAQTARTMEAVLATNKETVAGMAAVLACPCSTTSLVQLLLAVVCGNLIEWNSAMISADLEHGDPFDGRRSTLATACSFSADSGLAPRVRVLSQPITIGQHQINGSLGRALRAQVMAGELRVLEGLVEALSRRFCDGSRSDSAASNTPIIHTHPQSHTQAHTRNANGRTVTSPDGPTSTSKGLSHGVHRHITSSLRARLQITRAQIFSRLGQAA